MGTNYKTTPLSQRTLVLPSSETGVAYLAGIIDGEGCISTLANRNHRRWKVGVGSTSEPLMEWLKTLGGRVHPQKTNLGKHPCWQWEVNGFRDVLFLLEAVRPYLRIKGDKADLAIADLRIWIREDEEYRANRIQITD